MSLKILIVLGIVTLIASCASSKPLIWTKAGSTEAQFVSDNRQCVGAVTPGARMEVRQERAECRSGSSCTNSHSPSMCKAAHSMGCALGSESLQNKVNRGVKYCLESKGYWSKEGN
jgi:hypothetical protein